MKPSHDDERLLQELGYKQELSRRMGAFSNFAISLSIICILAGGITSFHVGLCAAGGAGIALGWPLGCLFSLCVAATMAQVASAFPTAGGLYHWGSILGGRACGWVTAWFNLAGLITVLAAINAGTYDFTLAAFGVAPSPENAAFLRTVVVVLMTLSQGLLNHYGIRLTTRLTDLSGWLILAITAILVAALAFSIGDPDWSRLWRFENFSGLPEAAPVFPKRNGLLVLFALGLLLPAYTITGFDASAHTAEETVNASLNVARGIVRSVLVSGIAGWFMVCALLLAIPDLKSGADKGAEIVPWILRTRLPGLATVLLAGIVLTQYLCGLAALTSASRMAFAFARDGGLPFSGLLKKVNAASGSPSAAVWAVSIAAAAFTLLVPYATIAAICAVFLYLSYVLPVVAGLFAYGRTWTRMGSWTLGSWYRPLAVVAAFGCLALLVIGVQPPNELALRVVGGTAAGMAVLWWTLERRRFKGPPPVRTGSQ